MNIEALQAPSDVFVDRHVHLFLAEITDGPDVTLMGGVDTSIGEFEHADAADIGEPVFHKPAFVAKGIRIQRVVNENHEYVTGFDIQTGRTDLSFIPMAPGSVVLASARPGRVYQWQLMALQGDSPDAARIIGVRLATEDEADRLNRTYPEWLQRVAAFDRAMNTSVVSSEITDHSSGGSVELDV